MVSALPTIEIISGGNTSILHFEFCILHFAHLRDKLKFESGVTGISGIPDWAHYVLSYLNAQSSCLSRNNVIY